MITPGRFGAPWGMVRRRAGNNRLVTLAIVVIFAVLAVFATIAWIQDSTYGTVAIVLWVLTFVSLFFMRGRART
jgi:multisubunit Na+/H+ antiporter MnhF subunit